MVEKGERFFQELVKAKQLPLIGRIGTLPGIDGRYADRLGEILAGQVGIDRKSGLRSSGWLERADIYGAEAHNTHKDQQSHTGPQPDPLP
jgi:hypothetical protein